MSDRRVGWWYCGCDHRIHGDPSSGEPTTCAEHDDCPCLQCANIDPSDVNAPTVTTDDS